MSQWKCYMQSMKGSRHKMRNMLIQDRIAYKETTQGHQAISLVDGVGSTDINILAGEKITEYTLDFMTSNFETIMQGREKLIKEKLISGIQDIIRSLSQQWKISQRELSSTLLGVCIDETTGRYCAFHLGDGIILKKTDSIDVLSYPVHGLCLNQTVLTTSHMAASEMKLFRGKLGDITEFALLSDGVDNEVFDYNNELGDIFESIKRHEIVLNEREDDQSIILLGRN